MRCKEEGVGEDGVRGGLECWLVMGFGNTGRRSHESENM